MKCPQCGKEMSNGYISATANIIPFIFSDENVPNDLLVKHSKFKFFGKKYIQLTDKSPFICSQTETEAFYCTNCKFVIVPVEEKD